MGWLSRHSLAIQAVATAVTAAVALAALVGVKLQLDAADRLQQMQSARDAYRAHLVLAATTPDFAAPEDGCGLVQSDRGAAYTAFVDHLMYAAEQMLAVSEGWDETFMGDLASHRDYICADASVVGETEATIRLLSRFRDEACPAMPTCG